MQSQAAYLQVVDWDKLQYFLAVAEHGTLARAANALDVDATTVSRRVRSLENVLQQTLFERATGGFVLTTAGRALVPHAKAMAAAAARIQSADDASAMLSGQLRVSVSEGFGNNFIAPRLAQFTAKHPKLEVDLVASSGFLNPSRREADVAILLAQPRKGPLRTRRLTDYTLGLYVPAIVADPSALPFVGYIPDFLYAPELDYLSEVAPNRAPQLRSSSIAAQAQMIAGGAGIGVLPCFLADPDPALVRVRPEVAIRRTFWLAVHQEIAAIPRIRAFVDWIVDATTEAQPLLRGQQ